MGIKNADLALDSQSNTGLASEKKECPVSHRAAFLEVLTWTLGLTVVHVFATILLALLAIYLLMVSGRWKDLILGDIPVPPDLLLMLLGGDQMLTLLVTLAAVRWRFGCDLSGTLGLQGLSGVHTWLIAGLVWPLSCLSSYVYQIASAGWSKVTAVLPQLQWYDQFNTISFLRQFDELASLPMMLILLAVGPAIGEELVFRGVIGRRMLARWGVVGGVVATSLLFAMVHVHPVHVVAVIPLGAALHLVYLATRSFWAPVLLHFGNNAWATLLLSQPSAPLPSETRNFTAIESGGFSLLIAATVAIIVLGALLYRTRVRYLLRDGSEWTPGYVSAEVPPDTLFTQKVCGPWSPRHLATAATAWLSFFVAFAVQLSSSVRQ